MLTLHCHRLRHIPELKVREDFFTRKFAAGCSIANCNAACCRHGVMVGANERERILAHAELIKRHMEPHQDRNEAAWFGEEEEVDLDFPEGRAVGTQVRDYGCVFLDSGGRCVLQKAAVAEGMDKYALKPFFCVAYPVTIEDRILMIEDPEFTERTACCSTQPSGSLDVVEVCQEELQFVLGSEGYQELVRAVQMEKNSISRGARSAAEKSW